LEAALADSTKKHNPRKRHPKKKHYKMSCYALNNDVEKILLDLRVKSTLGSPLLRNLTSTMPLDKQACIIGKRRPGNENRHDRCRENLPTGPNPPDTRYRP